MADDTVRRNGRNFKNLAGKRFAKLTVLGPRRRASGELTWLCRCDCGNEVLRDRKGLEKGESQSCGCLGRRHGHARRGRARSAEYKIWRHVITRCTNPNRERYARYGKLGVCPDWRHDFAAFLAHVGPRPSPKHSLDRIDNERGYEIGNVRWATGVVQGRNSRRNILFTHDGRTLPLSAWAEEACVSYRCLRTRLKVLGWPMGRALTTPARPSRR